MGPTTNEIEELKRLFDRFDKDGTGFIDARKLSKLLEAHGGGNDDAVLEALAKLKPARKGYVSWSEFQVWWSGVAKAPRSKPRVWEADIDARERGRLFEALARSDETTSGVDDGSGA